MFHLYRKFQVSVIVQLLAVFLLLTFSAAHAQRPEMRRPQDDEGASAKPAPVKGAKRGARAIGVVEMLPIGAARLVPIALWMDGKYYDASLYGANPAPLAVQPGTVYEAQNYGQAAGTFVVNMPKLVGGSWAGDGQWKPYNPLDAQTAADAARHSRPKAGDSKAIFTGGPDEGPPVLRRAGSSDSSSNTGAASPSRPTPSSGTASGQSPNTQAASSAPASSAPPGQKSGRPTLKRPSDTDADSGPDGAPPATTPTVSDGSDGTVPHRSASSGQAGTASDDDPDRPVYRKSQPAAAAPQPAKAAAPTPAADDNDPDRPRLSRSGQPQAQPIKPQEVRGNATPPLTAGGAKKPAAGRTVRSYPAISDAGRYETRPLLYTTTPEQMQQLTTSVLAMALADIRGFAAKRPGPQIPKTAALTDYDLRAFDLDFSNSATLVLTAKLPVASPNSQPFFYYATIVARLAIQGEPQKVFSAVTDSVHLDAYPRLELIDAIDADSNGRGDLLFRQYSDVGSNYGLYRVFPYNMEKIFEGGSGL
jgi:hypothetical protein